MSLERVETAPRLNPIDLKELTNAKPPCITISVPFDNPAAAQIRLKNFLREAEQQLPHDQRALLEPLHDAAAEPNGQALVLFRSPDVFTSSWLQQTIPEALTIADHFQIRAILPQLTGEQKFYILALAQKDVRLLRCTDHSSEEAPLPPATPRGFEQWLAAAEPDHVRDSMSASDEHLKRFYRAVETGVSEVLRRDPAPLVLVGVEYELAMYHAIDAYDRTVPGGVHGAPDGLKGGEMHARALELVQPAFEEPVRKALEIFESVAPERRSTNAREIVKAAYDARIAHLFLNETGDYQGWFREATGEVKHGKAEGIAEEDLLNAAAVRTIAGGGNVFVLPGNRMPNGVPAGAVFRW